MARGCGVFRQAAGVLLALMLLALSVAQAAPQHVSQAVGPQWIDLQGGRMRAAVFRPSGPGPFPVLVAFHGGGGFGQRFLDWAGKFAGFGYVVLVGCWLGPHPDFPPPVVTCSLPPFGTPGLQATITAVVLVDAARGLPGVRANDLGLVGWSAGGTIATLVASSGVEVRAVVAIAGDLRRRLSGADPRPIDRVSQLTAPVLLLHGKKDVTVDAEESIVYEQAARAAGKTVEIFLYDNADHFLMFDPATGEDVYRRSVAFLNRYLRP